MPGPNTTFGLRDNHSRGIVADFLRTKVQPGSRLSVVSAYFTIYAYAALKEQLDQIEHLDFLFGEPSSVSRLDPGKTEKKAFLIDSDGLELANRLQQKRVAKDCARWIEKKVDIKTIRQSNLLHGKMYHVSTNGVEDAILGSSNFTVRGLGLSDAGNNIELNLIVDSNRGRQELKQRFLSFEQLDHEISALRLALYHPTSKLRKDLPESLRNIYQAAMLGGFTQEGRERILIAMMKINFLKRLESSVDSFRLTLQRTIAKIDRLEERITAFEKHLDDNPEIDYDSLTPDEFEDPDFDQEDFTIGGRRRIHLAHIELPEWLKEVRNDRTQLQFLLEKTQSVTPRRDGKLAELKKFIETKVREPSTNRDGKVNRKVLVFTAFADTARYLYEHLDPWARKELKIHTALVCGDGGNAASLGRTDYDDILTNFSPIAKRRADQTARFQDQSAEIDLLIATDCISEGQNLQDCDLLINYDIHCNPVRIIQRFGRIDRIGSRNDSVQLVNFWPVADLDNYLGVKMRVESRMALVDLAATQTDNLLDPSQLEDLIKDDLLFRDRQLKRLKDEVLDLEDLDDSVSLTDFSLDEFRLDLLRYLEANRAALEEAGEGLYAVVPPKSDLFVKTQPGVIFCLRHRATAKNSKDASAKPSDASRLNPLAPYYLVYVHDDGTVRFSFAQPKETILLLRDLAAEQPAAFEKLCDLFDQQTNDGADMTLYNKLLQSALASIERTFQKRAAASLLSRRGAVLPTTTESPSSSGDDFDLVTWLVILGESTTV
jgi:hypothetical protein